MVIYTFFNKEKLVPVIRQIMLMIIMFFPFLPLLLLIPYEMFINVVKTLNQVGNETYSSLQGNLLYPFFLWFSWGIYTPWEPRNIFTFYKYYYSIGSLTAPFVIYGLIFVGLIKKGINKYMVTFIIVFLMMMFLVKGDQEPLGLIYRYLIEHVGIFRVFRSPDNKFGFGVILALTQLLLLVASSYRKRWFILLLSSVILIQGWLIFDGTAIIGQSTKTSSTRVVTLPKEYIELINFINARNDDYGYIVSFPSQTFAKFIFEDKKRFIGQDLLPKYIKLPFFNISNQGGISSDTYKLINNDIKSGDLKSLKKYPIRYFLIRRDIEDSIVESSVAAQIRQNYELLLKNNMFELHSFSHAVPLIESLNIEHKVLSPIKYQIKFHALSKNQLLFFYQSFNNNWKLYPTIDIRKYSFFTMPDIKYLFSDSLFDSSHKQSKGYANEWDIDLNELKHKLTKDQYQTNADGSINVTITLYYLPQSIFNLGVLVAGSYFFISLLVLTNYVFRRENV
jgi:hypothetical protein